MRFEIINDKEFAIARKQRSEENKTIEENFIDASMQLMLHVQNMGFHPEEGILLASMLKDNFISFSKFAEKINSQRETMN